MKSIRKSRGKKDIWIIQSWLQKGMASHKINTESGPLNLTSSSLVILSNGSFSRILVRS